MYAIGKSFTFSAAHRLDELPDSHKCAQQHGHNYTVTVVLADPLLDDTSFVLDYGALYLLGEWLDTMFDHADLNQRLDIPTTAENLARLIYRKWKATYPQLHTVVVQETPKTFAAYSDQPVPIVWLP